MMSVASACQFIPHWNDSVWRGILSECRSANASRAIFIAEGITDIPAGFVVAACVTGIAELENLAVSPEFRRHGLGSALCIRAMAWARDRGADRMELEVRVSNQGAVALYQSKGFVVQGRRNGYYRNPVEDSLLLSVILTNEIQPGSQV